MIRDTLPLDPILLSFEMALKIDYQERDTEKLIANCIYELERSYKIEINKNLYELQSENMLVGESVELILNSIQASLKSLSLFNDVSMFSRVIPISLADVNYYGFGSSKVLLRNLNYLMDCKCYETRDEFIIPLTLSLNNIEFCVIKRITTIMLVLERLGVSEGVSVLARLLYLGGLVV